MSKLATVTAAVLCVVALAGCNAEVSTKSAPSTISQSDLEQQLVDGTTPDDKGATVKATCEGDLERKADATQDCHLDVGAETADVHVTVTDASGDGTYDVTPYLRAQRVADTIQSTLSGKGYAIDSVECDGDLLGVVDEVVTCTALPEKTGGQLSATVTTVDGLFVNFHIEALS
ncbi:MAG: hypothetical protein JWN22_3049 [Nocardioides sp.]|nr:hypothetical protein [Nocardioides sp.]